MTQPYSGQTIEVCYQVLNLKNLLNADSLRFVSLAASDNDIGLSDLAWIYSKAFSILRLLYENTSASLKQESAGIQ